MKLWINPETGYIESDTNTINCAKCGKPINTPFSKVDLQRNLAWCNDCMPLPEPEPDVEYDDGYWDNEE